MNAAEPAKRPRLHWRHLILAALGLVALYGVIGAFVVPPIAKRLIAKELGERLGRLVAIDEVAANPYTLQVSVRGLHVLEPDNRTAFLSFDSLDLDGNAASFYRLAPVIDEAVLEGLKVNLVRDGATHYNASDILARLARPRPKREKEEPPRFSVSNIRVRHARIDFDDRPNAAKHEVADIDIAIPFVSNLPSHLKEFVQPRFSAKVNGSALRLTGETLPFENSLRTHLALDLRGVDIKRYVEYSPTPLPVKIDGGALDAQVSVRFVQAAGKDPTVDVAGTFAVHGLAVSNPDGTPLATLANADVRLDSLDPIARRVRIASVALDGGGVALTRRADGSLALPLPAASKEAPSEPTTWVVEVGQLTAANYDVAVTDEAVKPHAVHRATIAQAQVDRITNAKGAAMPVAAKLTIGKGGAVDIDGTVSAEPLELTAHVDARHLDLVPYRGYAGHFQTVALKSGFASAKGTFTLQGQGDALRIGYEGGAAITDLATRETTTGEELLDWRSVKASGIAFKWSAHDPLDLAVSDVAVDRAYSRVVVTPEGKLNLQQLKFATAEDPTAENAPGGPPKARNVRIGRITFAGSRLDFTDHYIKPNYSADVKDLAGSVTGLSSDPQSRGVVDLKGSWDETSPVLIAGTINPLSGELYADIAAKGKDIDLTKLSAYSMRYAGYGIKQGRLTLDVKYHVEGGKVQGRNNIFLDQLTFGDKVESPEATKLPVLFAVNLLKDADGHINLELPISGSLEDPQFEIGAVVGQVVSNLLKKAVTSPFSLLSAALGGSSGSGASADGAASGDDLAYVQFDPGSDALGNDGEKKLAALAKALRNRPALKLELGSRADDDEDVAALKRAALKRKLDELKGSAVTDADYAQFLKVAYDAEAPKPKDAKDPPKEPPTRAQMEAFLLEHVMLGKQDLDELAARRVDRVRQYLMATGQLQADRLVLASSPDADKRDVRRVAFALR